MSHEVDDLERLKRNLELIVPENGLKEKLEWSAKNKRPLQIKLGFDPTAPDLHLGHAVVLKKLRQFQDLGHKIIIIIGDFTACIGDPTGKNKTRPPLSSDVVKANAQTYLDQLAKIIDLQKAEVRFNSAWLEKLTFKDILSIFSKLTVSQILQREDFNNRYRNNEPIFIHEMVYPIVQGYDSVMIESDVEMGGTDQLFNCLLGRDLQGMYQKKQQIVACVPILRGVDGVQKMSKSLNNYIGLTEEPKNMFGKMMSIPDALIFEYAKLVSSFSLEKIEKIGKDLANSSINPMEIKKELALDIVAQFHGADAAKAAETHFYHHVQAKDASQMEFKPIHLKDLGLTLSGLTLLSLCSKLQEGKSKGELRRLIEGGGVTINGEKITDPQHLFQNPASKSIKLKLGKREFFEIFLA